MRNQLDHEVTGSSTAVHRKTQVAIDQLGTVGALAADGAHLVFESGQCARPGESLLPPHRDRLERGRR